MGRILLVDDDAAVASRHARTLRRVGHTVATATTVAAALAAIRDRRPDIVVLEGVLDGGLAGFDLARTLADEVPSLPMIMVTRADEVLSRDELARQDRDGGWIPVERYLAKPVMPEVLATEVDHVLERSA
jgi:CheY-like chemotaxis protein